METLKFINFEYLKSYVSIEDVCNIYGVELYRRGNKLLCRCPFHVDKNPSLYIYPNNYWYCFGCTEHGDVITFVSKLYNLTSLEAANKLMWDFSLDASSNKSIDRLKNKSNHFKNNRYDQFNHWKEETYECMCIVYKKCLEIIRENEMDKKFDAACNLKNLLEYWLDILQLGNLKEQEELRKEIGDEWMIKNIVQNI